MSATAAIFIIVPLAGEDPSRGARYMDRVGKKFMIEWAIRSLKDLFSLPHVTWVFVARAEHVAMYSLDDVLPMFVPPSHSVKVVALTHATEGAADTVLRAYNVVCADARTIVCFGDEHVEWGDMRTLVDALEHLRTERSAALVTFSSDSPKFSYARLGSGDLVARVAEKTVISSHASAGIYMWSRARDLFDACRGALTDGSRVNGAVYVAPLLNRMLAWGRVRAIPCKTMWSLGVAWGVEKFELEYVDRSGESLACDAVTTSAKPRINVLVPMAGHGSRFAKAGYVDPKPFIDVRGKPMIEHVIANLAGLDENFAVHWIFVIQRDHDTKWDARDRIRACVPAADACEFVMLDGVTDGSATTCMKASSQIDSLHPLIIANSDQWVDWATGEGAIDFVKRGLACDGCILTFRDDDPKWSYVRVDEADHVAEIREKVVISDEATVGIYMWRDGRDFCEGYRCMVAADRRVKGEFYTAPVYWENICAGAQIATQRCDSMWGLGTPDDLDYFLTNHH